MGSKNRRSEEEKSRTKKNATANQEAPQAPPPPPQKSSSNKTIIFAVIACGICFGLINIIHVSSMFENSRHFSHLSDLEREMSFRTEMGLYYSYYKTLVEADSFLSGLNRLMYDNTTEYPEVINVLQRFNLYPEVFLAGTFRAFRSLMDYFDTTAKTCWEVSRGTDLKPIASCVGIGEPVYWYLCGVWISAGFTAFLIFIHGFQLSETLFGGIIAVACFFFNHGEATRVQWTPPLRESFAFPWSITLNIIVTHALRKKVSMVHPPLYGTAALIYLLCWQFGQYTIALNIIILYLMYTINLIAPLPMLLVLLGGTYAFLNNIVFQFGNSFLLASPLAGVILGVLLLYIFIEPIIQYLPPPTNIATQIAFVFISSIASKIELSRLLGIEDDAHIFNIINSKISNYSDFHALLYTCAPEFDFISKETLLNLTQTFLLPCVSFVIGCFLVSFYSTVRANLKQQDKENVFSGVDCGLIYNLILLAAYGVMAFFIMRLKLFFTPQLCVVASLIANRNFIRSISKKEIHAAFVVLTVSAMAVSGMNNLNEQRNIMGEYSNPELEQLFTWVQKDTGQDAVFAGPMPLMANLLLSTKRPVVNHPHYENAALRQRTKKVYSVFSRRSPQNVYDTLLSLKVNYVILERSWCLTDNRPGCRMVDIWDVEEPHNRHKPALCPKLFRKSPPPFHNVFSNKNYVVLQVPSKYIEIPAPRTHSA